MEQLNHQFIANQWVLSRGQRHIEATNPFDETILAVLTAGDAADVDEAVSAARVALPEWRALGGRRRGDWLMHIADALEKRREALMHCSSTNNGKVLAEAAMDIDDAIACYRYYANQACELETRQGRPVETAMPGVSAFEYEVPVGVAGLITPWNFPLVTSAWKIAPALAAGCTIVFKPSEVTPLPELALAEIALEIGLPAGVFNLLLGDGEGIGAPLARHSGIDKLSFTGSNGVGEAIMREAAAGTRNLSLELGGKSPIVVLDDAEPEQAADWIMAGLYFNAGQLCSATSRLIVDQQVVEPVLKALGERIDALSLGNPLDPQTTMGPLASAEQRERVRGYLSRARQEGLIAVRDEHHRKLPERGFFVAPVLYRDVPIDSALWREEIFGPVLCTHTASSEQDAVALANDSDFGLAATVISSDVDRARRIAAELESGIVWFNTEQLVLPEISWGGMKRSGIGRELGPQGLAAYLEIKHVVGPSDD
ncbi:betaine-aldehyde dehydrogenase [Kushneria avicenniae]|uniref:Betaine-aldehyde dehydrogenase n=1 Tax=Kushneria avicenniae TaxID=402385 RepID=A0A1I1MSG4_9GAMM|nr:aldehyde dehydrogenase family protein [Kushneria avicenniae]SFC86108.1 betaine-aldehyde dehydrogenase [Kushneria avicenniae]